MTRNMQSYENLQHRIYEGVGEYGTPLLEATEFEKCEFIGFNYCRTCKDKEGKGVHFFLDDYQFNRIWNQPNKYLPILQQFRYVMTPDFSMYTDFPKIIQIYNHYRKHWIGAYLQENGVDVIPTISWSTPDSYEWCFDGEPTNGTEHRRARKQKNYSYRDIKRWSDGWNRRLLFSTEMYQKNVWEISYMFGRFRRNSRRQNAMGGRGSSSGVSVKGKAYGTEYTTLHESGNIKFVRYNDSKSSKTPMETMTNRRVYVTIDNRDNISAITYYDEENKRSKQIDLMHPHKNMIPHTHHGYLHNENDGAKGAANLTPKEKRMVESVTDKWYNRRGK